MTNAGLRFVVSQTKNRLISGRYAGEYRIAKTRGRRGRSTMTLGFLRQYAPNGSTSFKGPASPESWKCRTDGSGTKVDGAEGLISLEDSVLS